MATVLIADDEQTVRDVVRRILEMDGHRVLEAVDGEEAMRKLRVEKPDLVLVDLFMPRKEGLETIMQLRRTFPDVKIIAISGGNPTHGISFLETAKRLGAHRTLAKPFSMETIRDTVAELLAPEPVAPCAPA
ncbi:MAG: response regulator [Limisphaerales bacterium]